LEWFLSQQDGVKGFKKAIYSGFTTDELSTIIAEAVLPNPNLQGLYHVASEPISKFDLLKLFNEFFECGLPIEAETNYECDRSLDASRFENTTGYVAPSWRAMVSTMAKGYADFYRDKDRQKDITP
jgi:dTDP-4-dehydrorhamnose reductase